MTFRVREDGALVAVEKNIKRAGKAVNDLGKAQAAAGKQADDHYDKQNKGVIGTANSTRSFSKLSQTIGDSSNGLVGAYAGLAANAFAVSAAFNTLNKAAQAQTLMEGLIEQGARAGRTLTVLSGQLKEITNDSISSSEAMQATAQASAAGISGSDLKKLTTVANDAALALGRNVPDSLNRMVLAVTKMEPELVDELGLTTKITEASEKYARQLGINVTSMSQAQKQQALLNAWTEQGTLKYGGLADAIDPNPYNKLAATFDNLVKSGSNLINFFLEPLISILGSSQAALAGFGLIFLSSIKGQIMPGIQAASKLALKKSEEAKKISIDALSSQKELTSGKRKSINEFINASKEGAASQLQFEAAIKESNERIANAEKSKKGLKPETINKIKGDEAKRQEELNKIKIQSAKSTILQAQADGYAASEGVNLTNSYSKLKETVKATGASYMASYQGSKKAETGLKGLANTAASTGKGIAAAGKVAAVGFINFLPVIGQIVAALAILWEIIGKDIWAKLTGRTEEVSKAFDNFNEVADSTSKKIKALEAIQNSSASASDRSLAAISNQAASIYELADAYDALVQAGIERDKQNKKEEESSIKQRNLFQEMTAARRSGNKELIAQLQAEQKTQNVASRLGVSGSSMAAKAFSAQSNEFWIDDEYVAAAKALEQLEIQLPGVAKGFYDMNGGVEQFNKLDPSIKVGLVNDRLKQTAKLARDVENAFKSLDQSVSGLNTGYIDFIKSISPTTQYDEIVTKLQNFTKSVDESKSAIYAMNKAGGGDAMQLQDRLAESITGIEGPARNMFTGGTREILNYFDTIDTSLQTTKASLEGLDKNSEDYKRKEAEINNLTGIRKNLLDDNLNTILKEVSAYETLVINAQVEQIRRQGTLALAQANLKVLQKQGQITGEDVEKQMRAENAIIELQAQQLETQVMILQQDLEREKSALRLIESNQKLLDVYQKQTTEVRTQTLATRLQGVESELTSIRGKSDQESAVKRARLLSEQTTVKNAQNDIDQESNRLANEQAQLQNSIRVKQEGINTLLAQAKALRMGANTSAEILSEKMKKEIENQRESKNLLLDINNLNRTRAQTQRDILSILNLSDDVLNNENKTIRENAEASITAIESEFYFKSELLKIEIALAKSRGNSGQIEYYSSLLSLAERTKDANIADIQTQQTLNILNKNAIKDAQSYYTKLQDVENTKLSILNATKEARAAQLSLNEATIDLDAKRRGVTDTEATQRRKQIQAARANLDNLNQELLIKQKLITLEFALLKAKQAQTLTEAKKSQMALEKEKDNVVVQLAGAMKRLQKEREEKTRNQPARILNEGIEVTGLTTPAQKEVSRLSDILLGLSTASANWTPIIESLQSSTGFDEAAKALQDALVKGSETAAKNLEMALINGPLTKNGFVSQQENIKERQAARKESGRAEYSLLGVSTTVLEEMDSYVNSIRDTLSSLGPEGEIVIAAATSAINIGNAFVDSFAIMGDSAKTSSQRTVAALQAVSAVIAGVSSILKATSDAKIANIDKEIAAEEKRDGKSSASLEKIKKMEKKKDEIARKSFDVQKKLMMAQAVVSTAAAIAMAIGQLGPIAGPIMAGVMAAMGAAQIAIIAGTQYESASSSSVSAPSNINIGKRSDSVDLARGPNANAGGEAGFLRGSAGTGSNASNYRTVGSAYGGELMRGYGNRGFVVGEKGPEVITPETPITVTPANDVGSSQPLNATFNIQALDSSGVQDILVSQKGNIIKLLREAANASGTSFMENVNVNVYTRPNINRL